MQHFHYSESDSTAKQNGSQHIHACRKVIVTHLSLHTINENVIPKILKKKNSKLLMRDMYFHRFPHRKFKGYTNF